MTKPLCPTCKSDKLIQGHCVPCAVKASAYGVAVVVQADNNPQQYRIPVKRSRQYALDGLMNALRRCHIPATTTDLFIPPELATKLKPEDL